MFQFNPNFPACSQKANKAQCSNTWNQTNLHKQQEMQVPFLHKRSTPYPPKPSRSNPPFPSSLILSPFSLPPNPPSLIRYSIHRMLLLPFIYHQISSTIPPLHYLGEKFQLVPSNRPSQDESPTPRSPSIAHWQKPHERPVTNKL